MFQRVLQHSITIYMGLLGQWRFKPFKNWAIKRMIRKHKVDLQDVTEPDIEKYIHFNDFFTRALKSESRPIANQPTAIASPADGFISQIGKLDACQMIQAKNQSYSADALLGAPAKNYGLENGSFINIYLSPRDYHRVHMPLAGELKQMIYIPGTLFSVSPTHVEMIPNIFTRNERVVAFFETNIGTLAIVLVGAMAVGKIQMVWDQNITSHCHQHIKTWDYPHPHLTFHKGEEIGRFLLGSTVIVLLPKNTANWSNHLQPKQHIKMGEAIGHIQ